MKQSKYQKKSEKLTSNSSVKIKRGTCQRGTSAFGFGVGSTLRALRQAQRPQGSVEDSASISSSFVRGLLFLTLLFAVTAGLSAQSTAQEMETIFEAQTVTYAQVSRFALDAANVLAARTNEEAFTYAMENNMLPKNTAADDIARLDKISLLLMRAFNVKGGLFYSITKAPRYAYRELVYQQVIQHRASPDMKVSGQQFIFYVNRMIAMQEVRELTEAKKQEQQEAREAAARRRALAAEIANVIQEQAIADTTVVATNEGVMITLSNIMFQADSADLPNAERAKIREIARILRSIENVKVLVAGHTTLLGAESYLLELSRARAQSTADYLVLLDAVREENITIVGYGASRPIGNNATPQGQAANRRVEIIILER